MNKINLLLKILWHFTWGILQNLLGAIIFLCCLNCPQKFNREYLITRWKYSCGLSLGMFIFVPQECDEQFLRHECGHTCQSLLLGPLYLLVIGLPSLIWASLPILKNMRQERNLPYSFLYTERWADKLGKK